MFRTYHEELFVYTKQPVKKLSLTKSKHFISLQKRYCSDVECVKTHIKRFLINILVATPLFLFIKQNCYNNKIMKLLLKAENIKSIKSLCIFFVLLKTKLQIVF